MQAMCDGFNGLSVRSIELYRIHLPIRLKAEGLTVQLEQVDLTMLQTTLSEAFEAEYGKVPTVTVRAPGRVNLIGGHTDYNGGYVLQLNINRYTMIALSPREDGQVNLQSLVANEKVMLNLNAIQAERTPTWQAIVKAMAQALLDDGHNLSGFDGVISSDLPPGAGLGEDAALALAVTHAFCSASGIPFDPIPMARLAREALRGWGDLYAGLADMLSVAASKPGEALLVDVQSGQVEHIPFPKTARVILVDVESRVKREELATLVRTRRGEAETAANAYRVGHLRDLSMSRFEKDAEDLDTNIFNRARHFLMENGRVILAAEMLRSNAVATVGRLMNDSHTSLRDNYNIHSDVVESLVSCVLGLPNVLGARGNSYSLNGTVVILVADISADTVQKLVGIRCKNEIGQDIDAQIVQPVGGVGVV